MKRNPTLFYNKEELNPHGDGFHRHETKKSVSPRESVISTILNYSKSLSVCNTRQTGTLTLVMN
jgi:hypothetical protein